MNLKNFTLLSEADDSFHICSKNGEKFTINKDKLNDKAKKLISSLKADNPKMLAEGGSIENPAVLTVEEMSTMPLPKQEETAPVEEPGMFDRIMNRMQDPAETAKMLEPITPEKTQEMVQNVGIPAGTIEVNVSKKAVPIIKESIEKAAPEIKAGFQKLMGVADDILGFATREVESLSPAQQKMIAEAKDKALKAAENHLEPNTIARLERLDPEAAFAKVYSLPEIKSFRQMVHKFKNLSKSGPTGTPHMAEGGMILADDDSKSFADYLPVAPAPKVPELAPVTEEIITPVNTAPVTDFEMAPAGNAVYAQPNPSPLLEASGDALKQSYRDLASAAGQQAKSDSMAIDKMQSKIDALPTQQSLIDKYKKKDDELLTAYKESKVDPSRFYKNQSTGNKILSAIGMLLSGGGSAISGQENLAAKVVNDAIERDIDAQKQDQTGKYNLWKMNKERLGDELAANLATKNQLYTDVKWQLEKSASKFKGQQAQANAKNAIALVDQELNKNRMLLSALNPNSESAGGAPAGSEQAFVNHSTALQTLAPKVAEDRLKKYIPGVGVAKIAPTNEDRDQIANSSTMVSSLKELQALATKGPTIWGSIADGVNQTKMQAIQFAMKDAYKLGVLSKDDYEKTAKMIADPGSVRSDKAIAQLQATIDSVNLKRKGLYDKLGVTPFQKPDQRQQAIDWIKANPTDPRVPSMKQKLGL